MTDKLLENIFKELEIENDDNQYSDEEIIEIEKSIKLTEFQKQSFQKQLKDYINGKVPYRQNLYLGVTPKILKNYGALYDKLVISQNVLYKISNSSKENDNYHHLPFEIIEKLPMYLKNPYLIIEGSSRNTLAIILELKSDTGKELLVSIKLDALEGYMDVTRITSAYGKKGLNSYLLNKSHKVLGVYNEKRTNQWLASRGLQLSKLSNDDLSINYIICKKDKNINDNFMVANSIENKNKTIICLVINMETKERKEKQIQLAKLFYEMGMEQDVILKISGIDMNEYLEIKENDKNIDKSK